MISPTQEKPSSSGSRNPLDKQKILVVDDEMLTCKLVRSVLVRRGYEVEMAENGQVGYEKALALKPDLIITDIVMPVADGFELVKKVRTDKTLTLLPIIMLSVKNEAEHRVRGFRLGADDFLPKPFYPEELILRVQKVLEKAEQLKAIVQDKLKKHENDKVVPDFTGDLKYLGFSTILTMFELERKSGVLSLKGEKSSGLLLVRDGRIVSAQVGGERACEGKEAVYELLRWISGAYVFKTIGVEGEDQINATTQSLLFEGARRLDERSR